jgi:sulfide:quinone oxidoreductase
MADRAFRVVIAGGGVAALEAALALQALAGKRVGIEVVAPEPHFYYRPLAVAAPFAPRELRRYDLGALLGHAGALLTLGAVTAVDADSCEAHTDGGAVLSYDALIVACGATPRAVVDGALTFRGPADLEAMTDVLEEAGEGLVRKVVFAIPGGAVWSLPVYELALLTASWLQARDRRDASIVLTTPEEAPLELFGPEASAETTRLLELQGIEVRTRARALAFRDGELVLASGDALPADRVITIPRLVGQAVAGIPQTRHGFIPIDRHCRVEGISGVYAAGDITTFPVKQGGIAAQQADVAAQAIAGAAGADVVPQPFRPVLRGMLLTGSTPRFMRHDLSHPDERPSVSIDELWWPPAKIAGHYLGPLINSLDRDDAVDPERDQPSPGIPVDVELDAAVTANDTHEDEAATEGPRAGDVAGPLPLVAAPEDTLGEVADRMVELDVGSAVVVEYGRTIGIVTTRDMLTALARRVHSSEARVRAWMTASPITIRSGASVATAAALMIEHGVHHLPVVDESGHVIGMLGSRDIDRAGTEHVARAVR